MHRESLATSGSELSVFQSELDAFTQTVMAGLEAALSATGAPHIDGR